MKDTHTHMQNWLSKHADSDESIIMNASDYLEYKRVRANRFFDMRMTIPISLCSIVKMSTLNAMMEDILAHLRSEADKK